MGIAGTPIESSESAPERIYEELTEVLEPAFGLPRLKLKRLAENVAQKIVEIQAQFPLDAPHVVGHWAFNAGKIVERRRTRRLILAAQAYMNRVGVSDPELTAAIWEARE